MENGAASSTSHGVQIDALVSGAKNITDEELSGDLARSLTLQSIREIPILSVMSHQDDLRKNVVPTA